MSKGPLPPLSLLCNVSLLHPRPPSLSLSLFSPSLAKVVAALLVIINLVSSDGSTHARSVGRARPNASASSRVAFEASSARNVVCFENS
uniref:Putative secreted protein n=1 Tax=Ixodes ricinus TaxID=34613 RepID=A0A6B0U2M1_IXORI